MRAQRGCTYAHRCLAGTIKTVTRSFVQTFTVQYEFTVEIANVYNLTLLLQALFIIVINEFNMINLILHKKIMYKALAILLLSYL